MTPARKAFSTAWLLGRASRAARRVGWSRPRGHVLRRPGGPGGMPDGLVTAPAVTYPPQAGLARREATGRRQDRLGRGPGQPVQA